ncbi:MAG: hypothetical protein ACKO9Z_16670 [Planctomycetota bacterium]|nr:hypothetical protein [Planctomycetota bacterium]
MRKALPLLLFIIAGCGDSTVKTVPVGGKVIKDGKPFIFTAQKLPPGEPGFRLEFLKLEDGGKEGLLFSGQFNPADGSFSVKTAESNGLPLGKYKVIIAKGARGLPDEFKNQFSKDKSPLSLTITDAKEIQVEIDLDKKTASAR